VVKVGARIILDGLFLRFQERDRERRFLDRDPLLDLDLDRFGERDLDPLDRERRGERDLRADLDLDRRRLRSRSREGDRLLGERERRRRGERDRRLNARLDLSVALLFGFSPTQGYRFGSECESAPALELGFGEYRGVNRRRTIVNRGTYKRGSNRFLES